MKTQRSVLSWRLLLSSFFIFAGCAIGQEKTDFKNHPFFQHMIGEWVGEGELKDAHDTLIKFKTEWKADVEGENAFVIEGNREINGNAQTYKWTIIHNPTTGAYEANHKAPDSEAVRFEVLVPEGEMRIEMTVLGNAESKMTVIDSFPDKEFETLETKVTIMDDSGATTLSGTIIQKRVKKG